MQRVVKTEMSEIERILARLDQKTVEAVKLMASCQGKIVVAGVGKNMPIAQKMVATLNSTGTPAQFLHAGEALHGDLGLINKNDICLVISKSGNTAEIRNALPSIKQSCDKLIALTGNTQSYLATHADIILDASVEKEAGVEQLAPTSSTTVQLVWCDAIAMALKEIKNFRSADFGKLHPGGSLGKQLSWRVADILDADHAPQVQSTASIREVISSLSSGRYGITAVMEKDEIVGVITDGDLRRMLEKYEDISGLFASDIATHSPKTISANTLAKEALRQINQYKIGQLLVVNEDNQYLGVIDFHGLTKEGFYAE